MPRLEHSATLLPNGKVLIAGGMVYVGNHANPPRSAELYDPETGTFSVTGDMTAGHAYNHATVLRNGKVLIAGGTSEVTAEIYDPVAGKFTTTGSGSEPSVETAALLANGKVLITRSVFELPRRHAELYDPSRDAFDPLGVLAPEQYGPAVALLTDGKVLFAGGWTDLSGDSLTTGPMRDAELYDPDVSAFSPVRNMTIDRANHTITLLPDGTVLLAGGVTSTVNSRALARAAELYDPAAGAFYAVANLVEPRSDHTATLLNDGTVLIAGGSIAGGTDGLNATTRSAELYKPPVLVPAPVLLSLSGDGRGQGAIQHADTYQLVSQSNPAVEGDALIIYCTGLADGSVIPPQAAIGGRMAEVLWFGKTPGFAGLNQVNVKVPSGIAQGPAVPVRLNYVGRSSNEVTIAVR
jgi:hypothetical protein